MGVERVIWDGRGKEKGGGERKDREGGMGGV